VEPVICGSCKNPVTNKTEVEYSDWINEYFCNADCATNRYFDYMQSRLIDFESDSDFVIRKGQLFEKD
jgi:hypothetical protein